MTFLSSVKTSLFCFFFVLIFYNIHPPTLRKIHKNRPKPYAEGGRRVPFSSSNPPVILRKCMQSGLKKYLVYYQMIHKQGLVYVITSTENNKCYVGTTRQSKEKILVQLKSYAKRNKKVSSNEIMKTGNYEVKILEQHQTISTPDLKKRAGVVQQMLGVKCVNVLMAGRTQKDSSVRKEFYQRNREKVKEYYERNKQSILRNLAIKNMRNRGSPPTAKTCAKYNITQKEIKQNCF